LTKKQVGSAPSHDQKPAPLNQLTLSASLVKKDATTQNSLKGRMNALSESIDLIDLTQPQSNISPDIPTKNVSRRGQDNPFNESKTLLKGYKSPQPCLLELSIPVFQEMEPFEKGPSDCSDNDLEDLPSPSVMLAKGLDTTANYIEGKVDIAGKNDNISSIIKESLVDFDDSFLSSPSNNLNEGGERLEEDDFVTDARSAKTGNTGLGPNILDSIGKESAANPFLKTSKDPMLGDFPVLAGTKGRKREAVLLKDTEGIDENSRKRLRHEPTYASENQPGTTPIASTRGVESCGNKGGPSSLSWEGIDPLLMEEFKDLVNFF
jgi:hypothetical protein